MLLLSNVYQTLVSTSTERDIVWLSYNTSAKTVVLKKELPSSTTIPKLSSFGKDSATRLLSLIVSVEILDVLVSKKIFSFFQLKLNNKVKINFSTWHPEGSKFTLKLWIFLQSILGHYCGFKLVSRTIQWETLDFLNDNFVRLPQTFQRVGGSSY